MGFFTPVDNSLAVLRKGGVFTEAPLFVWNQNLYARARGGYVRLKPRGMTGVPGLVWEDIDVDPNAGHVEFTTFDARLVARPVPAPKAPAKRTRTKPKTKEAV